MKPTAVLLGLVLAATLAGCTISQSRAKQIAAQSGPLFEQEYGDIPASKWPVDVAVLKPERVYRTREGVYICTWRFFVEERGVFLLDPASSFSPGRGDPSFELLAPGIYTYRLAG